MPVLLLERELPVCQLPVLEPATSKPSAEATAAGAPILLPRLTLALIVDIKPHPVTSTFCCNVD